MESRKFILQAVVTAAVLLGVRLIFAMKHPLPTDASDEPDDLQETLSFRKDVTGVDNTIFISPRDNAAHGPRVKVAVDPPDSLDPRGRIATITFDGAVIGAINPELARQVDRFIQLNREVLLAYWNYEIDANQLQQGLQSIAGAN
jgi:hypothetical protein